MELLKRNKVLTGVLVLLVAAGIGCWIYQLVAGLTVTGMNNGTSWGLYITSFMFFVGLSAGGLIVASSASVFHIEKYKTVALPAVILSTVCICLAGMFVLIDLGNIQNIWRLIIGPNPTSPLLWDVVVITVYLVINILYLVNMHKGNDRTVSILSRFALPTAILVHSVTAWIFGLQISMEGWYSAILAPIFVASAMDSGLGLLLITLVALNSLKIFETPKKLISSLAGLMATCIAIDAFFIFCELLTMAYPGTAGGSIILSELFAGQTAPFFWIEVIVGLIVPFVILVFAKNRENTKLVVISSACVMLGVFFKRIWLLLTSFITPDVMGAPGIISGSSSAAHSTGLDVFAVLSSYAPTAIEIFVVLGVVSLGVLAFIWLTSKLVVEDAKPASTSESSPAQADGARA